MPISDLEYLKDVRERLMREIFSHGTNVSREIALKDIDEDILVEKFKKAVR